MSWIIIALEASDGRYVFPVHDTVEMRLDVLSCHDLGFQYRTLCGVARASSWKKRCHSDQEVTEAIRSYKDLFAVPDSAGRIWYFSVPSGTESQHLGDCKQASTVGTSKSKPAMTRRVQVLDRRPPPKPQRRQGRGHQPRA